MRSSSGYMPLDKYFPNNGLNVLEPSTQADPRTSPVCTNVTVQKGHLRKRTGYQALGSALTGVPMALINFRRADGTEILVCITTTKQYKLVNGGTVDAAPSWTDITDGSDAWDGDETNTVDWCVATGTQGTYLIVSNGKNVPKYWNGSAATFDKVTDLASWDFPSFVFGRSMAMYTSHFVWGFLNRGSDEPFTLAWGNVNSLIDFDGDGANGEILLTDTQGQIQKLLPLGDRLVIYCDDSIGILNYAGGEAIFSAETLVNDTRLLSARSPVNIGPYHLYSGRENLYAFDGTRLAAPIGDAIALEYREVVDYDNKKRAFSFLDRPKNNVYFFVPRNDSTTIAYLLEYDPLDLGRLRWTRLEFGHRITCAGFYSRDFTLTWDSWQIANTTWDQMNQAWDQGSTAKGYPVKVFGLSTGQIVLADDTYDSDSGTTISATFDTIDFTVPQEHLSEYGRWALVEFEARGNKVDVYTSIDGGSSFELAESVTLAGSWTHYQVWVDRTSKTFRVRFQNDDASSTFEIRWVRAHVKPAGHS